MMNLKYLYDREIQNYKQKNDQVSSVNEKMVNFLKTTNNRLIIYFPSLEANRLSVLRSYHGLRMSLDAGMRRPMNTIVELSPEQAQTPTDELHFSREQSRMSLSSLAQGKSRYIYIYERFYFDLGTLTNVFSTIVAMTKKAKANVTFQNEEQSKLPSTKQTLSVPEQTRYIFLRETRRKKFFVFVVR
jgi:hypothetical protein